MPRPRRCRRVEQQPEYTMFKPAGVKARELKESIITIDEYEAVRLKDLKGLGQEAAASKMNISQPTFNRLLTSARKKIADAIINGKSILIKGGNFNIEKTSKCVCTNCGYETEKIRGEPCMNKKCPECGSRMMRK